MPESVPSSPASLPGLTLEAVEWLPSGGDTGLVRVRGRWGADTQAPAGLPALCARAGGEEVERFESLPDAADREPSVWRGAYLATAQTLGGELWLQWESGERSSLPAPAGLEAEPAALPEPDAGAVDDPGGQVIDRAVMAERRARRAEASERAQARVAAEALRAVEALDRRSGELERSAEALVAERDDLAERLRELESTPAPAPVAAPPAADPADEARHEHRRRALADALGAAARARVQAREWRLLMRTAEVARSSDAVRLRVIEGQHFAARPLRAELDRREAELEVQRQAGEQLTLELARAREQAVSAASALDDVRRDFARRLADEQAGHAVDRAELASERGTHAETARQLAERESELAATRAELQSVRAELAAAEAGLRAEAVARAALDAEIDRERAARGALTVALDRSAGNLDALEADLAAERAARELDRAAAEAANVELEAERSARVAERSGLESLRVDLDAERAARATDREALEALRAEFATLRSELESARAGLIRAESALAEARHD